MVESTISDVESIFRAGIAQHHYANTAYPLDGRRVWKEFRAERDKVDESVARQWRDVDKLGLYVHIPFCKKRCLYCEYCVLSGEDVNRKEEYLDLLSKEIAFYGKILSGKTAVGLDIGGGTPLALEARDIERIVKNSLRGFNLSEGFGISIETTPLIAATESIKLKEIRNLGIERISMGVQTTDVSLLNHVGRADNTKEIMLKARDNIREAGFKAFNVDLMYGFLNQSIEIFASTLDFAVNLNPEYITLYRNRYKGTKLEGEAKNISLEQVNLLYSLAFEKLNLEGYRANLGKNTFSKIEKDAGTSAYLTKRVISGTPYAGFGLGAQSMASQAIYYNEGAATKRLEGYRKLIGENHFPIQDFYNLPIDEIMAKTLCVSFYFGAIDKTAFRDKFGKSLEQVFGNEVNYLVGNKLMENSEDNDLLMLTKRGKDVINGIIPLFYSGRSKENLLRRAGDV